MLNSFSNTITFLIAILLYHSTQAQTYGDKEFYLVDSLNIKTLEPQDKKLIDSSLIIYHSSLEDTTELAMLENIVDQCWNERVWPKYNQYLIEKVQSSLVRGGSPEVQKKLIYFLAGGISNRGFYDDQRGNLMVALNNYHESLKLYELIGNKEGIAAAFNNLGVIYSTIGDSARALEYHHLSLKTKKELKDLKGVALSYINIGTIYENNNRPFKALEYYESALDLSQDQGDVIGIAMSYDNIGDIYFSEKVFGKAFSFYKLGLIQWEQTSMNAGISNGKNNMANVLIEMNQWENAKIYALESYHIAQELGYPMDIENSSKTLVKIYEHENNFERAFFYSDLYVKMREKVKNEENANDALKKSMRYAYQKEALKDSLKFQKERELKDAELKQQKTQSYALYGGVILLLVVIAIGLRSYSQKKRDNQLINNQKKEVEEKNKEIEHQHSALAITHKEISDSITYAQGIQNTILPTEEQLKNALAESFVFFLPKDVVSGDFYWLEEVGEEVFIAVADCTGHGVPGAMVSMVCHGSLNRAVREFGITDPGKILDKAKEFIIETFETEDSILTDGMDISLVKINFKKECIEWSGANNALYILRENKNEIEIIEADKQPVGKFFFNELFTTHKIKINKGDQIYLYTDGYMDQFGGKEGRKYKYRNFRDKLIEISDQNMCTQGKLLEKEIIAWKGQLEQVDDICIIGIKF